MLTKVRTRKAPVRIKTPTHILLFTDSKEKAMQILNRQNKTLSGFVQEKLEELLRSAKKKEIVLIECPKYENTLPLKPDQDPYDYNYPIETISTDDAQAEVSLSFSLRQGLQLDSI